MNTTVSMDPKMRLRHLEGYIANAQRIMPIEESRIQLLRCRLTAYKLVGELLDPAYTAEHVDAIMRKAYENQSSLAGREIKDPYLDPCSSQYEILEELKSYRYRDQKDPFMKFIRAMFKKVFVPTLRLLTDLCKSEKKYSWSEVLEQLQPIMKDLQIDVNWDECERHLEKYLEKASRALPSLRPEGR